MPEPRVLVLATRNRGKAEEVRALLGGRAIVETLADHPGVPETIEDGETFEANAVKKAEEAARALNRAVLADDSGLEVDALGGVPGVRSARYAEGDDRARYEKLLGALRAAGAGEAARSARFVCAMAFAVPGRETVVLRATCEGEIADAPRGQGGFGYDPVFLVRERAGRTMAELTMEEKNEVSHRGRALRKMLPMLEEHFSLERGATRPAPSRT